MATQVEGPGITPDEALQRLIDGNTRFVCGHVRRPGVHKQILADLVQAQRPHTTILGCSDPRVPPEQVFDAGLGELFVIRVAGNVFSMEIAGSLQYANTCLLTPLFVVLGHEGCGAIQAAMDCKYQQIRHRSGIQHLVDSILPGMPEFDTDLAPEVRLSKAVESNIRWTMHQILQAVEEHARMRLEDGRIKLVGAIYDMKSGRVRFLE